MRPSTGIGILFVVACAFGLYQAKYMVRDVKKDVASLTRQLKEEQQAMHVLDAEWAHLIRPERLEALSAEHLGLVPASVTQLQDDVAVIPARAIAVPAEETPQLAAASAPAPAPTQAATPVNYAAR